MSLSLEQEQMQTEFFVLRYFVKIASSSRSDSGLKCYSYSRNTTETASKYTNQHVASEKEVTRPKTGNASGYTGRPFLQIKKLSSFCASIGA